MLPSYSVLNPMMDRLPAEELRGLQSERLVAMVRYVYDNAPFWRRKFDAAGLRPDDISGLDDLAKIPFCTKAELQEDQRAYPPFGSYVCTPRTHWTKFFTTSGTTGTPLRRVFSQRDWGYMIDRFVRRPHLKPGEVAIILGPVDGLIGPSAALDSGARMGAMMVSAGLMSSEAKIRLIQDLKPVAISGTASYLLRLLEVAQSMGVDTRALGLRSIGSVGEPGAALAVTRKRLADGWNAAVMDGYGMTEIMPLGGSCPGNTAPHIASDLAIAEIVDPDTGTPLAPGEQGELVFTNLIGDTQPLLRFRTRDISRLSTEPACPSCGHTGARLQGSIVGRVDDMIWYRGVNLFPSAVEAAVRGIEALTPEFQIEIGGKGPLPTLTVRVESRDSIFPGGFETLRTRTAAAIEAAIRVHASVEVLAAGALPRDDSGGKVRRVVDKRS